MISPEEIKQQALRWWQEVLQYHIKGENTFPRHIDRIGKIRPGEVRQHFAKIQNEIGDLLRQSKNETGTGYLVEKTGHNFRRSGSHELPDRIVIETLEDYLFVTARKKEWLTFVKNYDEAINTIPALKAWALSNTKWLSDKEIEWKNILEVCLYFLSCPRPDLYIRQFPIEVHTKFVEQNSSLLQSLLDFLIPDHIRDKGQKRFAERYFLRYDQPLIRLRVLEDSLAFNFGIKDLSIPLSTFRTLNVNCARIIITENKMNFLALPEMPLTIALWSGGGFNISYLKDVELIKNCKQLCYWGDMDEHGFQILHQLRSYYRSALSVMMDVETYSTFERFAVSTTPANVGTLSLLNDKERTLFTMLQSNPLKNRLEQEKIPDWYVLKSLSALDGR